MTSNVLDFLRFKTQISARTGFTPYLDYLAHGPIILVLGYGTRVPYSEGVIKNRKEGYPCSDRRATRTQENLERITGSSIP